MSWMFKLQGPLNTIQRATLGIIGLLITLLIWHLVTMGEDPILKAGIMSSPAKTFAAYSELISENKLVKNLCMSIGFNLGGYVKALLISLPVGFLIGLYPLFKGLFQDQVIAFRFVPLTAVTGIFIAAFGIQTAIKVNFLAFGIMIYLIPVIVQRIIEVQDVYLKTVYTLGATDWQTIKTVYIPSVLSKLSDDIRVLTAISWTYIIVAEQIGDQGGLGALIYRVGQRMGRPDKTIAILLIFILIGFLQDRFFVYLDKKFFPHKFQNKNKYAKVDENNLWDNISSYAMTVFTWAFVAIYVCLAANESFNFLGGIKPLSYLFEDTVWVIHFIALVTISYLIYCVIKSNGQRLNVPSKTASDD